MPLAEKALIQRIRREARPGGGLRLGIGDDCAMLRLPPGHELLVTTDFSLENVHFRRDWHKPQFVGHRCLNRGLSDIAAMGGDPIAAFLSLALPAKIPQSWVNGFMKGFLALAREFSVPLAGGDTAQSPTGVLADIIVLGSVPRGQAILRSGARPGDRIYVTGELGAGAAALRLFFAGKKPPPADFPRHFQPVARVAVGRFLRQHRLATAMIDLSDGLSTDLAHICEESRVGAKILATAIPRAHIGKARKPVPFHDALHGGDDYELLFTAHPSARIPSRIAGVPVTPIGAITRTRKDFLIEHGSGKPARRTPLQPQGWEHFRR